jgi:hypothetical protein
MELSLSKTEPFCASMKPSSANRTLIGASDRSAVSPEPTAIPASILAAAGRAATSNSSLLYAGSDASTARQPLLTLSMETKPGSLSRLAPPDKPPISPLHPVIRPAVKTTPKTIRANINTPCSCILALRDG